MHDSPSQLLGCGSMIREPWEKTLGMLLNVFQLSVAFHIAKKMADYYRKRNTGLKCYLMKWAEMLLNRGHETAIFSRHSANIVLLTKELLAVI